MAEPVHNPLHSAIAAGHPALLITGNFHDFELVNDRIVYRSQQIADELGAQGYIVIRFSKSQGGRIQQYSSLNPKEKEALDSRLNAVGLLPLLQQETPNSPEEIRNFFRAVFRLMQIPAGQARPVALIIDYGEHLAPSVQSSAAATDEQTVVAETLHKLANAPALRKSKNLLICMVRDGLYNMLLNDLHRVEYAFPSETQTRAFIRYALSQRDNNGTSPYGTLEKGFDEQEFARLTRGLRIRDIEAMLREARAASRPLGRTRVLAAKAQAILRASEGTLAVMSSKLTPEDIIGLEAVKRFFTVVAGQLKSGNPTSPRALLMVGPPGTSKSSFAPILASMCGFNILRFQNVKNMYVGESERRLKLALGLIESLSPAILFIDEITEAVPSRTSTVNDGGVSLDLLGQLFSFSARDDLRGRVLLLGASNVPERLDPAWHDRFTIVPFLELLPDETCKLFAAFERRMTGQSTLDYRDPQIIEASQILHRKGVSPRKILDIVNHALLWSKNDKLQASDIVAAAHDYLGSGNPMAVAYTSLVAISLTSFRSLLPWSDDPKHYVYPWYLEGVIDKESGEVKQEELHKRIQEYRRYTNL